MLVVDEAAAIPLPLVERMFGPYLILMASTVSGYEGTGVLRAWPEAFGCALVFLTWEKSGLLEGGVMSAIILQFPQTSTIFHNFAAISPFPP